MIDLLWNQDGIMEEETHRRGRERGTIKDQVNMIWLKNRVTERELRETNLRKLYRSGKEIINQSVNGVKIFCFINQGHKCSYLDYKKMMAMHKIFQRKNVIKSGDRATN